ncbi:MAG: tetratricopeptide repeat protein, partial [Leptospiraceae bacterium]|nr:tetratricopeptide repeat protein [Leptospiraceae bacterium]
QAKIEKNSRDNTSTTSTPETSEADRLNREGVQFYQAGKYDDAIQKFEASLKIRLKTLGEDHIDTAISYYNIGLGYVAKGEFVRGIEYFEKSLKIKIKILGEDHPNVVAIKANISTLKTTITTQKDKKNTQTNKEALLMEHYNVYNDALNQKGDYNTALIEAEKVLELAKEIYGEEDPNYAVCYGNAGLVYKKKGEYHKALKYYDKSLKILLKTVGENHELTAMNYNNIGATYRSLGEIDKAMEYYKKSLGIYIKTVGEMNLDTAMNYSNIGEVLFVKGEYNKSLEYLNKAFNSSKRLGENHPAVKTIKDNLDRVKKYAELELSYQAWQDSKTTETYRTKAKEVFKKEKELFGTLHLKSAGIMNYTGIRYLRVGKYTDAKKAFQIALQIRTKFLGENHPETAISYNNMGEAYRYQGEYDKAIEYLNKSLAIQLKTLEENHLETAISYNNLGLAYVLKGQYEEGIENYNKSLTIQLKLLGENNKYVALLYNNLGAAYLSKGEYDKALKYLQKALDIRLKVLGENTPHTTSSYNNLGGIYHNIGEYDKALEYLTKALSIRLKIHGEKHPDTANSYNSLGMVYDQIEKYDEAINNYKKSLSIRLEILGKNHPDIAGSYNNIGHAYYSKKEYDKAIKYFTKSYTISRKVLGENHLRTVIFYSNLGGIYYSKGEYNKAIDYYKKTIQKLEKTEERDILIGAYTHLKLIYIVNRQIPQAIETLQKTVGLILQSRLHIYGKDKGKFMTRHFHLFKELVELYNQTGQYDKAFKITEKMRGLSLLENFQLQYALKESGVDRKLANDMLKRKGEIESHYSEYSAVLRQGEKGQVYAKSLKDKILTEERELERLDKSLEKSNPLYAKNRKIQIPDIPSLQKQLGEANKTLIEYTLNKDEKGKESLTAFVISKNGFQAISLGTNLDLSLKIQNLRRIISKRPRSRYFILGKTVDNQDILFTTSDLKTEEYSCKNPNETERTSCKTIKKGTEIYRKELQEEKNILQTKDTNHAAKVSWKKFATIEKKTVYTDDVTNDFLPRYLKEIYSICIQPLYDKNLLKTKDILISPDASIYTIPFSALIDKDGKYWNEKVTLSMIHSASIWMKLRESKNRKYSYPIFAMGNPFYSDKYAESKGVRAADMRAVTKSGALSELPLDNLPGSAEEIKYIKKEIYHQENSKHIKERISANKQELRDSFPERKPNYKTVHFSVHGLFFPDAEELNSLALTARGKVEKFNAEALKQYETRHKKKVPEDGFLKMGDVIDLGIKSDLVVMSACETSLGSEKAGEGMVGLPQAFLMAGSQNTLATLWSVDDKGTMEFFKKFYKYYLLQKVSLIANRSLQRTQSRMYAKDNKYKDPYYWSAFVLYGE